MKLSKFFGICFIVFCLVLGCISCNNSSNTPYIGENGNWWVGDTDLGYSATGPKGDTGEKGDTGAQGETGVDGNSVTVVSVDKLPSLGKVDTYKITFSDGNSTTYTVTNGTDGESITIKALEKISTVGLVDTYKITFSDGSSTTYTVTNGSDGKSLTITSFEKVSSVGLVDTYKIIFSDGTETTYVVKNGVDGKNGNTPYIGANGNWWIDDYDTGVLADPSIEANKATEGLSFEIRSIGGITGMVVTDYTGAEKSVVIPNSVGHMPVIGIDKTAFYNNTYITSVQFSKNTIYTAEQIFDGCSALTSVNFNECKIDNIPKQAFRGTKISHVTLPDTVTKLNPYAFANTPIIDINYSNITYFGENCLNSSLMRYMYLKNNVTYIGTDALDTTFLYFESETISENWKIGTVYALGCKISGDYLYYKKDGAAVVVQYLGDAEKIAIPATLDNLSVKEIGQGFNSLTDFAMDELVEIYQDYTKLQLLKEVIIPKGVAKIDYAFSSLGTLIHIPSSVHTISSSIFGEGGSNFIVFEDSALPTIKQGFIESGSTVSNVNRKNFRYALNISQADLYYSSDKEMYFCKEGNSYSLIAYMGLADKDITIPATVNKLPVLTIRSYSISSNFGYFNISLEQGIAKIQAYAIYGDFESIYIPKSVTIINAYGIDNVDYCFVEASEKPNEWDTYWASTSNPSNVFYNTNKDCRISDGFLYKENNSSSVTLIAYKGTSSTINIPRKIDGKTVVGIHSGFFSSSGTRYIYIPKEVVTIEQHAFVNTSSYYNFYFYIETAGLPSNWNSEWYYNSYSQSSNSYIRTNFSYNFSY